MISCLFLSGLDQSLNINHIIKKYYVRFLILTCLAFPIYMFNGIAFNEITPIKFLFEYKYKT